MIVCPDTSPLLVLARIDRLDLLGPAARVVLTEAVLAEVQDKRDEVAARVEALATRCQERASPTVPSVIDPGRDLGPGERSVLAYVLGGGTDAIGILDDAAARSAARRLGLRVTGTLGLVLRAKVQGRLEDAAPVLRAAVDAGLYLTDEVLATALAEVGEAWPERRFE